MLEAIRLLSVCRVLSLAAPNQGAGGRHIYVISTAELFPPFSSFLTKILHFDKELQACNTERGCVRGSSN
jgi:hypothetical protein